MALPIASSACFVIEYGPNDGPDITPAIDDTMMIRPAPLATMRGSTLLRDRERAEHVDLEEVPHPIDRHVGHRPGLARARVVDEHVDVPVGGLGDVARRDVELLDRELRRLGAQCRGLVFGLGGRDDVVTALGQGEAGALPEPGSGAGDHHGLRHLEISGEFGLAGIVEPTRVRPTARAACRW